MLKVMNPDVVTPRTTVSVGRVINGKTGKLGHTYFIVTLECGRRIWISPDKDHMSEDGVTPERYTVLAISAAGLSVSQSVQVVADGGAIDVPWVAPR
jgi:hypothetical protein